MGQAAETVRKPCSCGIASAGAETVHGGEVIAHVAYPDDCKVKTEKDRCCCDPEGPCLGVPGESDACGACLVLDPEEPCLNDPEIETEDWDDEDDECQHEWELRSEHDTWVCAWCQAETTAPVSRPTRPEGVR